MPISNLDAILDKKIVGYKIIGPSGPDGIALRLEDGTTLTVQADGDEYHERIWADIRVTSPDDDQWITKKGI